MTFDMSLMFSLMEAKNSDLDVIKKCLDHPD